MRKLYTLLLFYLTYSADAQEQFNPCSNFCAVDLSTPQTTYLTDELTYFKPGTNVYCNSATIDDFDVQYKENSCGTNQDLCSDSLCALKIHVYYPAGIDVNCKLHAVILFHGGAYNECGNYNDAGIIAISKDLAIRGYAVFNVNYRLGVIPDPRLVQNIIDNNPVLKYVSAQQMLAIYRALQDARGAIRSIIAMQLDGTFLHNGKYQIDPNNVFLGGVSAGSLIALSAAYFGPGATGQGLIDMMFPNVSIVFGGTTGLGPIDPKGVYYIDPPHIASNDYFNRIKGILNCWGALFIPNSYLSHPYDFFSGQGYSLPPIISFCGKNDTVFNYNSQGVYFSPKKLYKKIALNTELRCLPNSPYTVPADNNLLHPIKYETCIGSQTIYFMLKTPGTGITPIPTEFYLDCDMYHGLDTDDPLCHTCTADPSNLFVKPDGMGGCKLCGYQSNFGTQNNTAAGTYDYIAARATTFFQTILGGATSNISASRFVECENKRVTCTGTTNSGCSNDTQCPN
ncbi:MAG: alpha/beta hydrolase [Bacteroidetes bacterium]|nr:alpha/beta hydrolase [Bacteroidota bacterium]